MQELEGQYQKELVEFHSELLKYKAKIETDPELYLADLASKLQLKLKQSPLAKEMAKNNANNRLRSLSPYNMFISDNMKKYLDGKNSFADAIKGVSAEWRALSVEDKKVSCA